MKTQEEVKKEIDALKIIQPKVRHYSMFGDNNRAAIDAQIVVLENDLDDDDIYDMYDHADASEYVLEAALEARNWIDGESESDNLAEEWPLEEIE